MNLPNAISAEKNKLPILKHDYKTDNIAQIVQMQTLNSIRVWKPREIQSQHFQSPLFIVKMAHSNLQG